MFKTLTIFEKLEFIFMYVIMIGGGVLFFYPVFFMPKETAASALQKIIAPAIIAYGMAFALGIALSQERNINIRWHKPIGGILLAVGIILLLGFFGYSFYRPDFLTDMKFLFWGIFLIMMGIFFYRYDEKKVDSQTNTFFSWLENNNLISWLVLLGSSYFFIRNVFATLSRVDSLYINGFFLISIGSLLNLKYISIKKINQQQNKTGQI